MKRETIHKIIEQELREAVEKKLQEAPEITSAARKARALGLTYMGFSRWTDESPGRPVVAVTKGGSLRFKKGFNPKVSGQEKRTMGKNKRPEEFITHPDIQTTIDNARRREHGAVPAPSTADLEFFKRLVGKDSSPSRIDKVHSYLEKKSKESSASKAGMPPQEMWQKWLVQYERQYGLKGGAAVPKKQEAPKAPAKEKETVKKESISEGTTTTSNTSAISKTKSWVNTIRNPDKKSYAEAYTLYLLNGSRGEEPNEKQYNVSKYMAKRVRENLEKHYYDRYFVDNGEHR